MTTKLTDKNISNVANLGIQWQAVITADGSTATTAVAGRGYLIDTTSNAHTINLPASAIAGDTIAIKDYAGTFGTNNLTIGRNGSNIQGVANDSLISSARASLELVYVNSTRGWVYTNESNVADLQYFVSATGGTITTDGDFKIHTFTGDGCFVVTDASPVSTVNTLIVAGGGGSYCIRGPGSGAGGFRCLSDVPVSVTSYPIIVGAGGAISTPGSNSSGFGYTSAGGGGCIGASGGSGSGGFASAGTGGAGNNPPVSPPQGNPGGNALVGNPLNGGGGGGGAGAAGAPSTPSGAGAGGNGAVSTITGSPVTYAGGGGGSVTGCTGGALGGSGGGGAGAKSPVTPGSNTGVSGTANTGGGGGGGGFPGGVAGTGGKGIVIIRYKFQ